jgi:hypothetical protein
LALNGGIRWVSLNERKKAVNERRGKEDMRGKRGLFGGHYFSYWETVLEHLGGDWKTVLLVFGWRILL